MSAALIAEEKFTTNMSATGLFRNGDNEPLPQLVGKPILVKELKSTTSKAAPEERKTVAVTPPEVWDNEVNDPASMGDVGTVSKSNVMVAWSGSAAAVSNAAAIIVGSLVLVIS
jgi:hypothetical protein